IKPSRKDFIAIVVVNDKYLKVSVAIDISGDYAIQRGDLRANGQGMHSQHAITVVLDITSIRETSCEAFHAVYIVWLKQYFHIRQAILPVPAELIPEQGTLSIQFIPEMDRVFYHFSVLRLKVATEDRVDTTVIVDIFRIYAQGILFGDVVVVVLTDIPYDVVRVAILVEVGSVDAVPESGVVFKSRLLNAHQT